MREFHRPRRAFVADDRRRVRPTAALTARRSIRYNPDLLLRGDYVRPAGVALRGGLRTVLQWFPGRAVARGLVPRASKARGINPRATA
jgi:hypothetical protein